MRKGIKVRRVVRRFELWSVAKVALVFHLCCYLVTMGVTVLLWKFANSLGTVEKLEQFFVELGWERFSLEGKVLFRALSMGGLLLTAVNVLATVLLAFFYNCVSGIIGGIVVSVLEQAPAVATVPGSTVAPVPAAAASSSGERQGRRRKSKGVSAPITVPAASMEVPSAGPRGLADNAPTIAVPSARSAPSASSALAIAPGDGSGPPVTASKANGRGAARPRPIEAGKRGRRGPLGVPSAATGGGPAAGRNGAGAGADEGAPPGNGSSDGWPGTGADDAGHAAGEPGDWTLSIAPDRGE